MELLEPAGPGGLGGDNSSSSSPAEGEQDWLIQLPHLVVDQILLYLDVESLLALRLTHSRTKEWVEGPKFLSRLPVTLRSESDLNDLLSTSAPQPHPHPPWSNFCFLWDDLFTRTKAFSRFISIYPTTSLAILDFSKSSPEDTLVRNDAIVDILLASTHLRSIKICELSCPNITRKKGLETLIQNWRSLKSLSIDHMLCPEYHGLTYFSRLLLEGCGSLEELDPPTIALSSPEYLSFNYKLYFKLHIVQPILQFLQGHRTPVTLKKLHAQEHLFDGDPGLLFALATSCLASGTVLHPETFLPFSRSAFMAVPSEESALFRCLGRLGGINDVVLSLGRTTPLTHLTFLSVSFRSFFLSDEMIESCSMAGPPLLHLPSLKEVEIEMSNDPPWLGRPHKLSRFMQLLCSSPHPSVLKLVLAEVSRANDTTLIRAVDVVQGFPSLTRLEVSNWDGGNSEFQVLWKGLHSLTHVQLRFCHHLGDQGFQGMEALKGIRVLILNDVGPLTDECYISVFRHLPLRSFYHYSSSSCLVTRKGYNSLGTGLFRSTIRQLLLQNSNEFRTMDSFCEFLAQFPKLRRPEFDLSGGRVGSCVGKRGTPLYASSDQPHQSSRWRRMTSSSSSSLYSSSPNQKTCCLIQ